MAAPQAGQKRKKARKIEVEMLNCPFCPGESNGTFKNRKHHFESEKHQKLVDAFCNCRKPFSSRTILDPKLLPNTFAAQTKYDICANCGNNFFMKESEFVQLHSQSVRVSELLDERVRLFRHSSTLHDLEALEEHLSQVVQEGLFFFRKCCLLFSFFFFIFFINN